ncbi:hypothetical protein SAMN04488556_4161 [Halostagnicola kamekurae]|uniref:Uncharacterized protein n=1 Tax=Halostagnicola kamekurae TaxID=619731 RepID=A0A1I6UXW0_9EURY|nr:hypothetical protein SAMN04488556_4161 [Halostagnicola kamekurae]
MSMSNRDINIRLNQIGIPISITTGRFDIVPSSLSGIKLLYTALE